MLVGAVPQYQSHASQPPKMLDLTVSANDVMLWQSSILGHGVVDAPSFLLDQCMVSREMKRLAPLLGY